MRSSGPLGFLPILTIALSCSIEGEPKGVASDVGGASGYGGKGEATAGTMPMDGTTIVAPNLGDPGDCCSAHEAPGCDNDAVEACVCEVGTYCCSDDGAWDTACVRAVDEMGCGICPIVMSAPGGGGAGGAEPTDSGGAAGSADQLGSGEWSSCCEEQPKAGCGDTEIELNVCTVDGYCCEKRWDRYCALEAETLGGAPCATFNGAGGAGGQAG